MNEVKNPLDTASLLIFERSEPNRQASAQIIETSDTRCLNSLPQALRRQNKPRLPAVSELQAVRHYTNLSRKNFSIDTNFYPLGSCTMKYNPRGAHRAAMQPGFLNRHPLRSAEANQGLLQLLHELQTWLADITGMQAVSLTPMAGAQGEFAGVAMIRAYHEARGDTERTEIIVPTAAHGTNPATAVMCGYKVREIAIEESGDVDLEALKAAVGPQTAGLMLTNPSTCGVFERRITEISKVVHKAGGLLYYDGANMNAILGQARPGDMGFDVLHLNLHKTFATPHGGGGPGAGPVAVNEKLAKFLPGPVVQLTDTKVSGSKQPQYHWHRPEQSIGRLSTFMGNVGVLIRAHYYAMTLGREGLKSAAALATLNANYLMARLEAAGFKIAFPGRRATHEFIISLQRETRQYGTNAMDFAKRLLDYGFHAPTTYFPLLIPECWLIEPTETEAKAELDRFVDAVIQIRDEAITDAALLQTAPYFLPVKRLDEVKAAKELILTALFEETPINQEQSI